jgi:hypothetical protein
MNWLRHVKSGELEQVKYVLEKEIRGWERYIRYLKTVISGNVYSVDIDIRY